MIFGTITLDVLHVLIIPLIESLTPDCDVRNYFILECGIHVIESKIAFEFLAPQDDLCYNRKCPSEMASD